MGLWNKVTNMLKPDNPKKSIELRQGTMEFEAFVAKGELELGGNLKHGITHLANCLSYCPPDPEALDVTERYLKSVDSDPESIVPKTDQNYYTTEALRAYIWHREGKLQDATRLICDITSAVPTSRYFHEWLMKWLQPSGAIESIEDDLLPRVFVTALQSFDEAHRMTLERVDQAVQWARLLDRVAENLESPSRYMIHAGLCRKAGLLKEAEMHARAGIQQEASWHSATALGLALRQQGKCELAAEAFRQAATLDPTDFTAFLEAGDTFFERQMWKEALPWYEEALRVDSIQPWAKASSLYCNWKLTDDEELLTKLVELSKENERAYGLVWPLYYSDWYDPSDAVANLIRQIVEKNEEDPANAPTGESKLTLDSLEAPSNFLALKLDMQALGSDLHFKTTISKIPKPDPRVSQQSVKYLLWKYEGIEAIPNLPPPSLDVSQAIGELCAHEYDGASNWASCNRLAREFGVERIKDLLAVSIHPPAMPAGRRALEWLPRVQLTTVQVIGQIDDAPWLESERRAALLSLLHGPLDWTINAAIFVLARLGTEHEALSYDIHKQFELLEKSRPRHGFCCWEATLYEQWLEMPHLFDHEKKEMKKKLEKL